MNIWECLLHIFYAFIYLCFTLCPHANVPFCAYMIILLASPDKIDLMTYEIEFDLFIVFDIEAYRDNLAVYRTLIS